MSNSLTTLYKTTKTDAVQVCKITTSGDTYTVTWGQKDGAQQSKTTKCFPKNVGRANATTGEEQAEKEALAKWVKKKDTGYSEDEAAPVVVQLPQKVKKWDDLILTKKRLEALIFPCWVEDKENGINGTYQLLDGKLTLWSRGGKEFVVPPHHIRPITDIMYAFGLTKLNVELFIENYHLEDIQSAVTKHNPDTQKLVARIFEFPEADSDYTAKYAVKKSIKDYCNDYDLTNSVSVIMPQLVHDMDQIDKLYDDALARNREGIIITNGRSKYQYNTRSSDVWKRKPVQDAEYLITDMEIDKNGNPKFVCLTGVGDSTFKVTPKGDKASREAIIPLFETEYKGKYYKVEFEMLSKTGTPTKPVGIGLRECDHAGEVQI